MAKTSVIQVAAKYVCILSLTAPSCLLSGQLLLHVVGHIPLRRRATSRVQGSTLWSIHDLLRPLISSNSILLSNNLLLAGPFSYSPGWLFIFRCIFRNYITSLHGLLSRSAGQSARATLFTVPRKWQLAMLNVTAIVITSIMGSCHLQGQYVWPFEF